MCGIFEVLIMLIYKPHACAQHMRLIVLIMRHKIHSSVDLTGQQLRYNTPVKIGRITCYLNPMVFGSLNLKTFFKFIFTCRTFRAQEWVLAHTLGISDLYSYQKLRAFVESDVACLSEPFV